MASLADRALHTFRAEHAPVFAALWRRFGAFDLVEAAMADAYQAAMAAWPSAGVPQNPASWMATVAMSATTGVMARHAGLPARGPSTPAHDLQALVLGCCQPDLTVDQGTVCLLRALVGLMPFELSDLLGVPEDVVTGHLDAAKIRMRQGDSRAGVGDDGDRDARLARAHAIVARVRALPAPEAPVVADLVENRLAAAFPVT